MKLLSRTFLGLDVDERGLRVAALQRGKNLPKLVGGRELNFAGPMLKVTPKEHNVQDPAGFVVRVREVLQPLAGREDRVALSLPDAAGRLILHETDATFKSKAEGIDVLKWQLKQSLPDRPQDVRVDYQILWREDNGRCRLAVAAICNRVLQQYEDLLDRAGFHAAVVDFHTLHLYNHYRLVTDLGEDFVLISVEGTRMGIQLFQNRQLVLQRSREIGSEAAQVFQEVNRTCAGNREAFPGLSRARVYLHSDWTERLGLTEALSAAFEREITLLDPRLDKLAPVPIAAEHRSKGLAAAVGAACRLM